jgi:hypothetical protein
MTAHTNKYIYVEKKQEPNLEWIYEKMLSTPFIPNYKLFQLFGESKHLKFDQNYRDLQRFMTSNRYIIEI